MGGLTPNLEEVLLWLKCYQIALHATEKLFLKGRVNQCGRLHCCLILRNCHGHAAFTTRHPDQSAAINIKAKPSISKKIMTAKGLDDG